MGYNLLLVDDSNIIRKSLKKALAMTEMPIGEIFEAENGEVALEVLESKWIDLVFLDINMPVMNGVDFLKAVRSSADHKTLPVLIVSTEGSALRYEELEKLGISGVLRKPVRPEALTEAVTKLLGEIADE